MSLKKIKNILFSIIIVLLPLIVANLILEPFYGSIKFPLRALGSKVYVESPNFAERFTKTNSQVDNNLGKTQLVDLKNLKRPVILFVGESTLAGYPFNKNQSSSGMTRILLEYLGVGATVINLSTSAITSKYINDVIKKMEGLIEIDFIIVYSGHNELLGFPSILDYKGSYLENSLDFLLTTNIALLFRDLINSINHPPSNESLMDKTFRLEGIDIESLNYNELAKNYWERLLDGLSLQTQQKIIWISPVSNVFDMPPFRLPEHLEWSLSSKKELTEADFIEYQKFLDQDQLPYRLPPKFYRAIVEYLPQLPLTHLDLPRLLIQNYGWGAFSNKLFIDHLHLNLEGHFFLAKQIVQTIFPDRNLSLSLQDVLERLNVTDFDLNQANLRIIGLLQSKPYREMKYSVQFVGEKVDLKFIKVFQEFIKTNPTESQGELDYLSFLGRTGRLEDYQKQLSSLQVCFPGNWQVYYLYALYYQKNLTVEEYQNYLNVAKFLAQGDSTAIAIIENAMK